MAQTQTNPIVVIETSMGTIKAELWADKAPITVANFTSYVDKKFYDALIFHRVKDGFMIQGGGLNRNMQPKPSAAPIKNEASSEVPNDRGTLAMARTGEIHSATAQFFINLSDNDFLNHKSNNPSEFGYCVFGKVIEGQDVVDAIGKVKTATIAGHENVPVETIESKSIRLAE